MKINQTIQERLASPEVVGKIRDWLKRNKHESRLALAEHLCKELALKDPRGKLRLAGVQKALRVLAAKGYWQLAKLRGVYGKSWQPRRMEGGATEPRGVPGRVEQVKGLKLVEVGSEDDELFRLWNELMLTEHPLRECRLVGRQLRYLIGSAHGWLGGIGFGSCALRLRVRDEWMGWDDCTRKGFQERLINMTRFLIRPQVRCENLASRVLSLCRERLAGDRHQLKAYYRFIASKREAICPEGILRGHRQQTIGRMKDQKRVLVIQDTTDLNFSERLHCNGLGDVGKNQTGAVSQGLKMHSSLAVGEQGLPLGVLRTDIYASHFGAQDKAQNRPIEEKESYRWLRTVEDLAEISQWVPQTQLIAVGDRESDLF